MLPDTDTQLRALARSLRTEPAAAARLLDKLMQRRATLDMDAATPVAGQRPDVPDTVPAGELTALLRALAPAIEAGLAREARWLAAGAAEA